MELTGAFEQLGLTSGHLKIYLYLLDKSKTTVLQMAQDIALPRTSCYDMLAEMQALGLVTEFFQEKTRMFRPESPRKLLNHLENKLQQLNTDFKNLSGNIEKLEQDYLRGFHEPKVKYMTGSSKLKSALNKVLAARGELLVYNLSSELNTGLDLNPKFYEKFLFKLNTEKINCREVLNYNSRNYAYKQNFQSPFHKIFLLRINQEEQHDQAKFLWEDNLIQIDFRREIVIQLRDKELAAAERDQFNYLWELLDKQSGIS